MTIDWDFRSGKCGFNSRDERFRHALLFTVIERRATAGEIHLCSCFEA